MMRTGGGQFQEGEEKDLDSDSGSQGDSDKDKRSGSGSSSSSSTGGDHDEEEESTQQQQPQQHKPITTTITLLTALTILTVSMTFLLGSHSHFWNHEPNKCSMTWMFKQPYYIPIPLIPNSSYPHYKLYAYVEGDEAFEEISKPDHRFTGIPVLFIPGNAGSHFQVRSLASLAHWKHLDYKTPFHFDFFSVDLGEEFSGLYGYSLNRQVEFSRAAVRRIAALYDKFHRVVLVGHSMGGVIAKGVVVGGEGGDRGVDSNLIITLATPHSKPVVVLDPEQELFYGWIKKNWSSRLSSPSRNVTLVSIAGGDRDVQVPSKLTAWPPFTTFHTTTTGIPGVWASTDHLCIVWCKELVATLVRALFDLVELRPRNKYYVVGEGKGLRRRVLGYHLLGDWGGGWGDSYHLRRTRKSGGDVVSLQGKEVQVVEEGGGGMRCVRGGLAKPLYFLFPVKHLARNLSRGEGEDDDGSRVIAMTTNTRNNEDWLMGCKEEEDSEDPSSAKCTEAEPLPPKHYHRTTIIPHMRRRRKAVHIRMKELSTRYTHLVVKMEPNHGVRTCVMVEGYGAGERGGPLLPQGSWGHEFVVRNKIFFNLTVNSGDEKKTVFDYLMAWRVDVVAIGGGGRHGDYVSSSVKCKESHHLLAQFTTSSSQQFRFPKNESLVVRYPGTSSLASPAFVTLFLEPTCTYRVTVRFAPLESAGQLFRLVALWVPAFVVGVVLMAMYYQDRNGSGWVSFHRVLLGDVVGLGVVPGVVVAALLGVNVPTDWPVDNPFEYSPLLPVLTNMIAYSAALTLSTLTWYALVTSGTAIQSLLIRLMSTRLRGWMPEWVRGSSSRSHNSNHSIADQVPEAALEMTLTRFPLTMAVLLLSLSFATCGSLGITAGLGFYLVRLFRMYEEGLFGEVLKGRIQGDGGGSIFNSVGLGRLNFHFSCFLLWGLLAMLNVPSLLHWTRRSNLTGDGGGGGGVGTVEWDLSMYLCLLLLPTVAVLWQEFVPRMEPTMWNVHRHIFYGVGLATILWGTHRLYVTSFLIVFVFLSMALCQLVSVMVGGTLLSSSGGGGGGLQQQQQQQHIPA